jgi:hypothetical protein
MTLIKKNEMLSEISSKLFQIDSETKHNETKEAIAKINQEIKKISDDKIWKEFSARFNEVHIGFYEKLLKMFPELSQNELRLCAFLRLNMTSKEISELTGQSSHSLEIARYRLRKTLGITNSKENLISFLTKI